MMKTISQTLNTPSARTSSRRIQRLSSLIMALL
jgi:hypothetical protein